MKREAYAVIFMLRKFKHIIFGSRVVVFSDHNPLTYLNERSPKSAKLTRWSLGLQEFDLQFRFKAGKSNQAADLFTRLGAEDREGNCY